MDESTLTYEVAGNSAGRRLLRKFTPEVLDDQDLRYQHSYPLGVVLHSASRAPGDPARESLIRALADVEIPDVQAQVAAVTLPRLEAPALTPARFDSVGHKWDRYEIELSGPHHGNPVVDVSLEATFTSESQVVRVPGFYDGEGTYRIRFLVPTAGEWTFRTTSNANALDGIVGTFTAREAREGNAGVVRPARTHHFEYADGSAYRPIGTTAYGWMHQPDELVEQTLETLARQSFNKIRMCIFPKSYYLNENEPELYPFEGEAASGFDFDRPNFAFFQRIETLIDRLDVLGIEADLILFHSYDRWGFSVMPAESDDLYVKYLVSRLASYRNVWWSLANEFDLLPGKSANDWERYAEIVQRSDPSGHLLSIHNGIQFYNHARPWITHCSIQQTHFYLTAEETTRWRQEWQKPIVIDECVYEGNIDRRWGAITGEEMTRRFWEGAVRGGYVGHGETYAHPRDILWWGKGGHLHGSSPARIAFLSTILAESPGGYLDPLPEQDKIIGAGIPNEYEILYFGFNQPVYWQFDRPAERSFRVDIIDTWNMTVQALDGTFSGRFRIDLPGRPYIALRLQNAKPVQAA